MKKTFRHKFADLLIPSFILQRKGKPDNAAVYLTFDDGPDPEVTPRLLVLLEKWGVKATFFVIGQSATSYPEIIEGIVSAGHTVGNHSYSHPNFGDITIGEQREEVAQANDAIFKISGIDKALFRAPRGHWSLRLLLYLVFSRIRAVHWSRDSFDFRKGDVSKIVQDFTQNPVVEGDIVLFHDDSSICIDALEQLIPIWQQQGLEFRAL